jgi:indole-3-glycerol phosphate synthase
MLHEIVAHKKNLLASVDLETEIRKMKLALTKLKSVRSLKNNLLAEPDVSIIAEIKRHSPSKGLLNEIPDIKELALQYEKAGARAISVLTEERFFQGTINDLICARDNTNLPVLRKDFILHEYQVWQSRTIGADAILLIAAILPAERISDLYSLAKQIGLEVIIEVHSEEEMKKILPLNPEIIGINSRNLKTFETDLYVIKKLISLVPEGTVVIAESGISTRADMLKLESWGADAALIGETIVTSNNPYLKIRELLGKSE